MNKFVDNKTVITSFLVLALIYFPSSSVDLFAQQRGNISVTQATALPLVNAEGNQVKLIIKYSMGDESIVGTENKCPDGYLRSHKMYINKTIIIS